jgi:sulfoxide reductase heme-binding subunit YedZ
MKRLGKKWKKLHRLVYLAGILAVVHFIWLVKPGVTQPWIYAGILLFLLVLRVKPIKKRAGTLLKGVRSPLKNRRASSTNN